MDDHLPAWKTRMPTHNVIRRATSDDISQLLELVHEYWTFEGLVGFQPDRIREQLQRLMADEHLGAGWIAFSSEAPVGYLLAVYVFSLEHLGLTAEIDEFFVRPNERSIGVGSKLLEAAEATFAEAGCTNVSLQLGRSNDAARAFYLRHGYAPRTGYELFDKGLTND
jgi:GNAT superfamily N-acetyltransferase